MSDSKSLAATHIARALARFVSGTDGVTTPAAPEVASMLAAPPKPEMGDFAFPCFTLARSLRQAPPAIAAQLARLVAEEAGPDAARVEAAGPYVNIKLDPAARAARVVSAALHPRWGEWGDGQGRTVSIDFSSPNIAKPFGIGHLRSTAIGHALANIHRALGYRVVRINHLGDWGTQFGKLMAAFEAWGDEAALDADPIQHLYDLYVKFHQEAQVDAALDDLGRAWFRRLEQGDATAHGYWQRFRALSLRVKAAGITEVSEGALVVKLDELNLPPCLLLKADGATLYATRDLAAARYRYEQFGFEKSLYVVGAPQSVHFKQVFAVLGRMNYPWASRCVHVPFGMILGISTRKGTLVFLEEILDKGRDLVHQIMADREGFTDDERAVVAEQVAIGAIIFYDLSRGRIKDYPFEWDSILRGLRPGEHGPTGPYLQYTHVRLRSLEERYVERFGALPDPGDEVAWSALAHADCEALIAGVERFAAVVRNAAEEYEPAVISRYLLELAEAFNSFYSSGQRVISDDRPLSAARIALVSAVRQTLAAGLGMLGVPLPARM
jgi:arginyl-tRNA synthetase